MTASTTRQAEADANDDRDRGPDQEPDEELFGDEHLTQIERLRRVAAHFGPDVRRRRRELSLGMLFSVLLGLARVVEPWPLKVVFDQVLFHKKAKGALTQVFLIFGSQPTEILLAAALVLMVAGVVHGVSYYYQDYLLSSAAQDIVYRIRTRMYRHLHQLDVAFHINRHVGDTLVRLSSDIVMLRDVLIDGVVTLCSGFVMLILMLIVMTLVDPVLTAVAAATMPLAFLITKVYGEQIRVRSRKQRKREGEVAALMHESLAAITVVQLNNAEEREEERFRVANRRSLKQGVRTVRLEAQMNRAIEVALAFGMVVVLWVGTLRALHNHITPGDLIVFTSYLRAAFRPLRRASKTVQRSAKALASAERIAEVLETEAAVTDAPDARPAPEFGVALELDHVDFHYDEDRPVLRDVCVRIEKGRSVALVGETGSGKSTLLSLLPRLYDPVAGRVWFDGADERELTLHSLRAQIAFVPQEAVLMGTTLADNIRFGAPNASDEDVLQAALQAGLGPLLARLPAGIDTEVAERGASLSGGERQRMTIARALARQAPILLLDEPTASLDAATKRGVVDTLLSIVTAGTRTAVIVTHELELAARADEIIVLAEGRVVGRGTYEELMRESDEFRRLADAMAEAAA